MACDQMLSASAEPQLPSEAPQRRSVRAASQSSLTARQVGPRAGIRDISSDDLLTSRDHWVRLTVNGKGVIFDLCGARCSAIMRNSPSLWFRHQILPGLQRLRMPTDHAVASPENQSWARVFPSGPYVGAVMQKIHEVTCAIVFTTRMNRLMNPPRTSAGQIELTRTSGASTRASDMVSVFVAPFDAAEAMDEPVP